ncbi:MobA/MobL family protein [Pleomorphomonas oryzae]|uniref:MobA/MobL family protein n=1 Tax=Pleomorphomonas oryzae TaxID=261934 RepID=UPI000A03EC1C|nr:MobA/MobL family protein [Pleomorphomonas oryzae]
MAIYHLHVKNLSRKTHTSIVAAAAYRAGATLPNDVEEGLSKFGGRRDVVYTEIRFPAGAPEWMGDRARLWNAVEKAEIRKDARLAKEIEGALPRELPPRMWALAVRTMAQLYAGRGHVVDAAIHCDGGNENPHAHFLLTTRAVSPEGFGAKIREADGVEFVTTARKVWAEVINAVLAKAGVSASVDHRSHADRGLDQTPTQHRGPDEAERIARRERTFGDPSRRDAAMTDRKMSVEEIRREIQGMLDNVPNRAPSETERALYERNSALEARVRELEAENERLKRERWQMDREERRALPDLDSTGQMVSRGEIEDAQDRMVEQVERPSRDNLQPPRVPLRIPNSGRDAAQREVLRESHAEAGKEPKPEPIDEMAWLREEISRNKPKEREDTPERERHRDR